LGLETLSAIEVREKNHNGREGKETALSAKNGESRGNATVTRFCMIVGGRPRLN